MNKMGKTICVFSPKGGVGKTVLSLNLAGICELTKKKVLLLDLDIQSGSLGMIINQEINKTQVTNNIEITIKSKKVYRSYEQYKITIKNNNSTTILLSDGKNSEDICLLDKNDTKYVAFLHEIPEYNLLLRAGRTTELNISFNKIYAPTRVIEKIQFGNITLNQETNTKTSITIKI